MLRVYVAFLKKSSAKNFLAERFLGFFKKSTLNRDVFSVERFTFILSGFAVTVFISQTSSLAVGTADSVHTDTSSVT